MINEAAQEDYVVQFLCIHKPATFNFATHASEARRRTTSISAEIAADGQDASAVRAKAEKVRRYNIERGIHLDPERQTEVAMTVLWLTMTGEAAARNPEAGGFVLEFSSSPLPSRSALNVTIELRNQGDEERESFVHYWTDTAEAVTKLNNALQARSRRRQK